MPWTCSVKQKSDKSVFKLTKEERDREEGENERTRDEDNQINGAITNKKKNVLKSKHRRAWYFVFFFVLHLY